MLEHQASTTRSTERSARSPPRLAARVRRCATGVRQAERDEGVLAGPTTDEHERIQGAERENRELRQANEILRKASAYFALCDSTAGRGH